MRSKSLPSVTLASLVALGLSTATASAQERSRHADVWTFGTGCRMTWNADASSFTFEGSASAVDTAEGCASFSDPTTGELLIYTDGIRVWDPAGTAIVSDLPGDPSSLHSGVIVPVPGSPGDVYVFGHSWGWSSSIAYRRFNVTNGVTAIGAANTVVSLPANGAEGMLVVPHTNGVDYWLLVSGEANIFVLPVTSAGVGDPVATSSGLTVWSNGWSLFAISHQGDKLIMSGNSSTGNDTAGDMASWDFNRTTGALTGRQLLNAGFRQPQFYGGVFSPNGRFFYFATLTENSTQSAFYQYGLDTGTFIEISRIGQPYTHGDGRLGPDGILYIAGDRSRALHTISNPDVACTTNACGFTASAHPQPAGCTIFLGLPQTPSPIVDVQLDLSVNILEPSAAFTSTTTTLSGSANAPDGSTVEVVVTNPSGATQTCTATVQGAAWTCPTDSISTGAGGVYTAVATLTFGNETATDTETFCASGLEPYAACYAVIGCADGSREGFTDTSEYPTIASCGGAWDVPGMFHDGPECGRAGGNDGANEQGTGCNVEDLCAPGWRVCHGPDDVELRTGANGCTDAIAADYPLAPGQTTAPGQAIFVGRTSGPGNLICDNVVNGLPASFNDIFGCGNFGSVVGSATCSPLNRSGNNQCGALQKTTPEDTAWSCDDAPSGGTGFFESQHVTKDRPHDQGGVMCCKITDAALPEICDGRDNNDNGLVDETDFDNDGATDDYAGQPCDADGEPGRITCTTDGSWTCTETEPEVCESLLDDDTNGYVDVYDPACQPGQLTCTTPITPAAFTIRLAAQTDALYEDLFWPITGDIDADGRTEILAANRTQGRIDVLNGETLAVESSIAINGDRGDGFAIANLDADPQLEVVAITHSTLGSESNRVFIANWNGSSWDVTRSEDTVYNCGGNVGAGMGVGVADFDADGKPEIFYGNEIWTYADDLSTVSRALDGDAVGGSMKGCVLIGAGPQGMVSIVADVLSAADCDDSECDGPELIVAGQVFSVDIGDGSMTLRRDVRDFTDNNTFGDGFTAVADLDNDGDLDVVVAGNAPLGAANGDLYAYDPRNEILLGVWDLAGSGSHGYSLVTIADVFDEDLADDGDTANGSTTNVPEMIATRRTGLGASSITAINVLSTSAVWELAAADDSGSTATTVFDYNGDGILELAYRDEDFLRVMYGGPMAYAPTGVDATSRNYAAFACTSATMNEGPIVADVDDDGAAELVAVCGTNSARLTVFESDSAPWRQARRVWNQPIFDPGAIDEWGRVYPVAQARNSVIPQGTLRRPLNVNLAQSSPLDYRIGDPNQVAAIDAVVTSVSFTNPRSCRTDPGTYTIEITIRNDGDAVIPDSMPIAIYPSEPGDISPQLLLPLYSFSVVSGTTPIAKGESATFRRDTFMNAAPTIWVSANDTGDGPSLGECDLEDNVFMPTECTVLTCNPDDDQVPNEGCDFPTPACQLRPWDEVPTCVVCTDDTAGGIDSGCNAEVPSCNPFTNECGPCADDPACQPQGMCPGSPAPTFEFEVNEQCLFVDQFPIGELDPVVEWQRSSFADFAAYDQVMMQPVVGNLTDDNEDGAIDEHDVPDIVFTSFNGAITNGYTFAGVLRIISGDSGAELFATDGAAAVAFPHSSSGVALGDIDGNGRPDIVVGLANGSSATVGVWEANVPGQSPAFVFKWKSNACGVGSYPYTHPAIANVDGQGDAEIIMPGVCVLTSTGTLVAKSASTFLARHTPFAANMDDDPALEIVDGVSIYDLPATGTTLTLTHNASTGTGYYFGAVADMDGDGRPELVYVSPATNASTLTLYDLDAAGDPDTIDGWSVPIEGTGAGDARGGPPTIADFDGDGQPEIGVAGESSYTVYEADGTVRWARTVQDASSSVTGSAVFDFDGDGAAEVVYADELTFYIYDGSTGDVRASNSGHASGTLFEYPIIVDVDRDGAVEIVLASNNYAFGGWNGITAIGSESSSWTPARPVWNQHAYSISNINDDLSVPVAPVDNWTRWNNFRAGAPLAGLPNWQADVFVAGWDFCEGGCDDGTPYGTMSIIIGNQGLLDADNTTVALFTESQYFAWGFALDVPSGGSGVAQIPLPGDVEGPFGFYIFTNAPECDTSNNQAFLEHGPVYTNLDEDEFPDVCDACVTGQNPEVCDGYDNDCDGDTDEGCDDDEDGYCDATIACDPEAAIEYCPNGCGDCDDTRDTSFPGATEVCNGFDDDCVGGPDDDITPIPITCGVGACFANGSSVCIDGGFVDLCTPGTPAANDSVCNGIDDDCANGVDEDYVSLPVSCSQCRIAESTRCEQGRVVTPPCLPRPDGLLCESHACALEAECQAGECVATRIRACDDGNPCTSDACDPEEGCVAEVLEDGTECSDRNGCTAGDTCTDGVCGGFPIGCEPPKECERFGECNPDTGVCDYAFIEGCIACGSDATPPVLVCPQAPEVNECTLGGNAVTLGAPSARDECSAVSIAVDAPNLYPGGTTIVTYTATDAAGNSTSCSVPVTVEDSEPPEIFCQEVTTVEGDPGTCGAVVTLQPTVVDDCDGTDITLVGYGVAGDFFPPGPTDVLITAIDAAGNQATCQTVVDVVGLDDFSISCEAEVEKTAPADFCGWPEALTAEVIDECDSIVDVTSETEAFPIGESNVVFDARRDDGKEATCTTKLTVVDATDPVVSCGHPPIPVDLAATFVPVVYDACTAEVTITGVGCERETNGASEAVVQRCEVAVEGDSAVVVTDAPPSNDGAVFVVWTVTATDPSGNTTEVDCRAPVDPESLDHDKDGVLDRDDNCMETPNADQSDIDLDGIGDVCDEALFDGIEALGSGGCEGGASSAPIWLLALALLGARLLRRRALR